MKRVVFIPWALVGCAVAVFGAAVCPAPVSACSLPAPNPHVIDPVEKANDQTPPALAEQPMVLVKRGQGPVRGCDGSTMVTSCDDIGSIRIYPKTTDDRSTPIEIGYQLRITRGAAPTGLVIPSEPVRLNSDSAVMFSWADGASDDQEAIDFTLELVPIDRGGNLGQPVTVTVKDASAGGGGCGFVPRSRIPAPFFLLGLAAIFARMLRKR
jgi:hypothetical protein